MVNRLVRYTAAMLLLMYGFAKINGSQFTILDSELDRPMGQVSGFWLTWYYFGYSSAYGTFLALSQIGGALLLTFRRTMLLGACVLVPVLTNIILIDIFFGVGLDVTVVAMLLLTVMLGIISSKRTELLALFWPPVTEPEKKPWLAAVKWTVRFAMVAIACGLTYWVANYNNRFPTPIDGAWDVVQVDPATAAANLPKTFFFEYNRASMVVFKSPDGSYQTHHFELNQPDSGLQIWDKWIGKGDRIFDGHYELAGTDLKVNGTSTDWGQASLTLRRRPVR